MVQHSKYHHRPGQIGRTTFDLATLEQLVAEAVNDAISKARNLLKTEIGGVFGGKVPPEFAGFFGRSVPTVNKGGLCGLCPGFLDR